MPAKYLFISGSPRPGSLSRLAQQLGDHRKSNAAAHEETDKRTQQPRDRALKALRLWRGITRIQYSGLSVAACVGYNPTHLPASENRSCSSLGALSPQHLEISHWLCRALEAAGCDQRREFRSAAAGANSRTLKDAGLPEGHPAFPALPVFRAFPVVIPAEARPVRPMPGYRHLRADRVVRVPRAGLHR